MEGINFCFLYLIFGIILGAATGLMGVPLEELKWNWAKTAWLVVLAILAAALWWAETKMY